MCNNLFLPPNFQEIVDREEGGEPRLKTPLARVPREVEVHSREPVLSSPENLFNPVPNPKGYVFVVEPRYREDVVREEAVMYLALRIFPLTLNSTCLTRFTRIIASRPDLASVTIKNVISRVNVPQDP